MKRIITIFFGILILSAAGFAQNNNESKNYVQSLTISVAPTFFATTDENFDADTFWPNSLYITKNFMLKPRLSISTGVHFLHKKIISQGYIISDFIPGYSGPTKTTNKYSIFDIPLRLNYYILKPNDKLNFYAKTEIKNSLIVNYIKNEPDFSGQSGTHTDCGYDMFLGIGFGFDFKVVDRFSLVIEPGFNYSVIGMLPEVGLFDCQFGIKYTLNKK